MRNSERPVAVHYFKRGQLAPLRTSYQMDLNRATANCFHHMMIDHYDADIAQVCENPSGQVYAEFTWTRGGNLKPTFKHDPAKYETRYSVVALLK
jgi:hypothetical protein